MNSANYPTLTHLQRGIVDIFLPVTRYSHEFRLFKGRLLGCFMGLLFLNVCWSQEVKIQINASEIAVNQVLTIKLTLENDRLKNYSPFPEIEGFVKRGTSSSTSTSFVNGKMSSSQSITQNYLPTQEGTFEIPPFTITVNGKAYRSPGGRVKVGPVIQQQRTRDPFDPFDPFDFFNNRRQRTPQEFVEVEAEAFLALTTDKQEVYAGEGFIVTLAFYVAESNRADMRFYDIGKQITEIVKNIKPENCWEENFNIDNINGQPVTLQGKPYTQYKVFQAAYYPLNAEDIEFPSVKLKLIKYKVARNPGFFGRNRQEDFETFQSKPKTVKVKPLPPHPLRDKVAVGTYRLKEDISAGELETGQSFNYIFKIFGRGNISAINEPMISETENFDFYNPNVKQDIRRAQNIVSGTKTFNYYAIPNEAGDFDMKDHIQWVYFDPERETYDTLQSNMVINVSGESRKNEYIQSTDLGSFYDRIDFEENKLTNVADASRMRLWSSLLVAMMFVISAFLIFRK